MDSLPVEILQEIMDYLRYGDLKCFRLVCKKFYEASLAFHIVNRDNIRYGDRMLLTSHRYNNFDNFMKILSATERKFHHFHFFDTEITIGFRDFVEKRAEFILSLRFQRCKIMLHPISFCESIKKCIKLKSLELHHVSWPAVRTHAAVTISSLLPALVETTTTEDDMSPRIPDDDVFIVLLLLLTTDTNVKKILHLDVDARHLSDVIYVRAGLKHLKCVDLTGICTDAQLMNVADHHLNLTTFRINCAYVTDRGFKYFAEKQRRLQIVAMRNCISITDESLFAIAEYLKDLKELEISALYYSFYAINRIINLTPVRRLDCKVSIDYSSGLAVTTAVGGDDVTMSKCLLRQLRMWNVQNKAQVTYIAENFLALTELELVSSYGVTNETLELICRNLKNLKVLILCGCDSINPFKNGVSQLTFSANFNNLEELNLSKSGWLSDSILETCFKLSSLRILNLAYCEQLTVKSFVAMPENFPCLEDLNMDGLRVDKDELLSTVSLMKRLCKLKIWVSEPITKHLLKSLYEHSDSLRDVNFDIDHDNWWSMLMRSLERKVFVDDTL